jgi:predicted RNA-binding Zn-ribbon protein involved in translation (DUF1610 family)
MTVDNVPLKQCSECEVIGNEDGTDFDNNEKEVFFECPDCGDLFCLKCDTKHKHSKCGDIICDNCWEEHKENCE